MSDRKRPHEGDNDGPSKKLKSDPTSASGPKAPSALTADAIAAKRAEIAAKMAAMTAKKPALPTSATVSAGPKTVPSPADIARRLAEARKQVTEAQQKLTNNNPYTPPATKKGAKNIVEPAPQGEGLKMAAHPLLLDTAPSAPQSKKDRYKPMQPKFASIKANVRAGPTPPPTTSSLIPIPLNTGANPYTAAAATPNESEFDGAPRERSSRNLRFNQKGKYISIGNQMRQEAKLDALKQRIAETAKKAGLDSEFETLERNIRRSAPPSAEWWDENLLPNKTYDDLSRGLDSLNIRTEESPITIYVQHPIPIPAPGEKNKVELKPLMLTKKEQKKMRKKRRQEEQQDKRDRIRAGLIPPDPPKVRLANMMKVLTSDAVQDPTKLEGRVRREVAIRKHQHDKMNQERKLTDEQRRIKREEKKMNEEKKGLLGAIFKITTLSDPAHRFKVRKNAEQMNLSGLCIFNPSFAMIYVEGAPKFIRDYKKLMLRRIIWTEHARARGNEDVELDDGSEDEAKQANTSAPAPPADVTVSLENNRCDLVWEGQIRERLFTNFRPKSCPTDTMVKEALGPKLTSYWDQAKNFKAEDEDLALAF